MITDEKIIECLNSIHEHIMARDIFVPLLKKTGLKGVRYTAGQGEEGVDVEYYLITEPDKVKSFNGIQFKKGNITYGAGGGKGTVKEVKNQAEEAFEKEIHCLEDGNNYFLSRFILATTGIINEPARKYIGKAKQMNKDRQIAYWEASFLIESIRKDWMAEFVEYFKIDENNNVDEVEEVIIDSDYIEENYSELVESVNKIRSMVTGFQWEIIQFVANLTFKNASSPSFADLLYELGQNEDQCEADFQQLGKLELLDIEIDSVCLIGRSKCVLELYEKISVELEEAEEDVENTENIFNEIL